MSKLIVYVTLCEIFSTICEISGHHSVRFIIRSRNLVSSLHRFQSPRGLSCEVSKETAVNQMTPIHLERRHHCDNWSPIHLWYHQSSPQCPFHPCGQTAGRRSSHEALNCHINVSLGRPPSSQWWCRPGRPHSRWVDQLQTDNLPPADLWRHAVNRGHSGATLWSLPIKL